MALHSMSRTKGTSVHSTRTRYGLGRRHAALPHSNEAVIAAGGDERGSGIVAARDRWWALRM